MAFVDCQNGIYAGETYDNQPQFGPGDPVPVSLGVETTSVDAALAKGGSVSGNVTDEATGDPLDGICVDVFGPDFGFTETDAAGDYRVMGLPAGDYQVSFFDCANSPPVYASESYDNLPGSRFGDPVPVSLGVETTGIDAMLMVGGTLSGTVTDEATGDPLRVCVSLSGPEFNFEFTDVSGGYSFSGLPGGDYEVEFSDCMDNTYAPESYDNQIGFGSADPVPVSLGVETTGINAALAVGGTIAGTVTDQDTGAPLEDICVEAVGSDPSLRGFAETDASGDYTITGLADVDYEVSFFDCDSEPSDYAVESYNDKPGLFSGDPVSVSPGTVTTGINAALAKGGSISGNVTDEATGDPLRNICVSVFGPEGVVDRTDDSGDYTISGLPPGDHEVGFFDCGNFPREYAQESYDDQPGHGSADLVSVSAGVETTGIDAALGALGPSIWGDNNCKDGSTPGDSLLTLRFDAGVEANTGDCPDFGEVINVQGASPHPWGDVDCSGFVDPSDSLKLLRFDAGLPFTQEAGCPPVGGEVTYD